MGKKKRVVEPTVEERLCLLQEGLLLDDLEVAGLAADLGTADYIDTSEENYIQAMEVVEKLLDHPSEIVRYNSLGTLAYEWGASSKIGRIKKMASSDPDEDCRRQAVAALGSLFAGTRNVEILHFLASIVTRLEEEEDVRESAYTGALDVLGIPYFEQPRPLRLGKEELAALKKRLASLPSSARKTVSVPEKWSRSSWSTLVKERAIILRPQQHREREMTSKEGQGEEPAIKQRLRLLKDRRLSDFDVAYLAADLGTSNYIDVSEENYIQAMETVEKLLHHPSALVRYAALGTLGNVWGTSSKIGRLKEIASSDPDDDCRRLAVGALGFVCRGTKNADILDFLESIVTRSEEEEDVRVSAYAGVLNVLGIPPSEQPPALGWTVGEEELATLKEHLESVLMLTKKTISSEPEKWLRRSWSSLVTERANLRSRVSNASGK